MSGKKADDKAIVSQVGALVVTDVVIPLLMIIVAIICLTIGVNYSFFKYNSEDVELAALAVETVVGDTDNQVVAQGFGAPQEIEVPLMEQIVSAVGNDFLHGFPFTGSSCA